MNFRRLTPIYEAAVLIYVYTINIGPRPRSLGPNCWWQQSESYKENKENNVFS